MTETGPPSRYVPASRTLVLAGDLDGAAGDELAATIDHHVELDALDRIDLSAVTFFPSTAVGGIARVWGAEQDRGRHLALVARPGSFAHRVLTVVALPITEV